LTNIFEGLLRRKSWHFVGKTKNVKAKVYGAKIGI